MNKLKTISLSLLLGMSLAGCEDILDENVNPDRAHDNSVDQGLPVVVFYAQQTVYDHAEYNIYLSQALTTMGKSQTGSYPYKQGWEFISINRHPQWRRHYYDIGVNVNHLIENSQKAGSPNYELIARTIRLMSMQLTTDAFGDMPLEEAYLSSTPRYETQAHIYDWMFKEAETLLEMYEDESIVNADGNLIIDAKQDRVYAGDLSKWKGLVYAVKARLLLRNIPNIDRSAAMCQQIIDVAQQAIDTWTEGDLMYGEWFGNEPRYNFDGGTNTQNSPWSESNPKINGWESRDNRLTDAVPSKFLIVDCMGLTDPTNEDYNGAWNPSSVGQNTNGWGSDPRLSLLFIPQTGPQSPSNSLNVVRMRYLENNIGAVATYKQANYPVLYAGAYAQKDGYNPIFTMEELYFIQAEAYYWMGGEDNKAKACALAQEATKWNIIRHLERFQADNEGKYPTGTNGKAASAPGTWNNLVNAFLNNIAANKRVKLPTEIGNKHWFFNASEYTLYDLMTQKYIAMYMQPEQWTDMRRYHYSNKRNGYGIGDDQEIVYPTLRRPYNLYTPYWVDGLTTAQQENTWIQRLNYDPQTEEIYNPNEVMRIGAYKNHKWLQKPMNWALDYGVRTSLTAE